MIDFLTEPLKYVFIQHALVAAILTSATCATVGVYVVLRRMAFIGDALAHAALPGLVGAYCLKFNLVLGALAASMLTSLGIGKLTQREDIHEDSAIGILFTGMFATGILLMSMQKTYRDFTHMLFGNLLGVSQSDLVFMAVTAAICVVVLSLFHKELMLASCDATYAMSIGLKPETVRYILLLLLAVVVVAGIQAVGVILTSALLVTPAAGARLISDRMWPTMLSANIIAIAASVVGVYGSFHFDLPCGATIVVLCTVFFLLLWLGRTVLNFCRQNTQAGLSEADI